MFNNIKNLINEVIQTLRDTNFKEVYSDAIYNTRENISNFKHKITHLFDTNLENGLNHYYSSHYNDALVRFKLMNNIWKNNPLVNYNLGRTYFYLNKFDKAKLFLDKAKSLSNGKKLSDLIDYFINKINNPENIGYIPYSLKKEHYNHSISSLISDYKIHENDLRKIFNIYNKYIGAITIEKGEKNTNVLDIGCETGLFSKFCKESYHSINIDGVDISENMIDLCNDLTLKTENNVNKIYNSLFCKEMHHFLSENYKTINSVKNEVRDLKEKFQNIDLEDQNINLNSEDIDIENIDIKINNKLNSIEVDQNELQKSQELNNNKSKLYDAIISIGTFAEFGELDVILKLCEANLNQNGLLIFVVPHSNNVGIQFSKYQDYFFYSEEYLISAINENTKLKILEILSHHVIHEDNKQLIVIARKP